jgi:hypothetical protein
MYKAAGFPFHGLPLEGGCFLSDKMGSFYVATIGGRAVCVKK